MSRSQKISTIIPAFSTYINEKYPDDMLSGAFGKKAIKTEADKSAGCFDKSTCFGREAIWGGEGLSKRLDSHLTEECMISVEENTRDERTHAAQNWRVRQGGPGLDCHIAPL